MCSSDLSPSWGMTVPKSKLSVGAYLDSWLGTVRPRLRQTTHAGYSHEVARATPLQVLTPLGIEAMCAKLVGVGHSKGTTLSPKTVRPTHVVLRRALVDAERLGLVVRNAARRPSRPRIRRPNAGRGIRSSCASSSS